MNCPDDLQRIPLSFVNIAILTTIVPVLDRDKSKIIGEIITKIKTSSTTIEDSLDVFTSELGEPTFKLSKSILKLFAYSSNRYLRDSNFIDLLKTVTTVKPSDKIFYMVSSDSKIDNLDKLQIIYESREETTPIEKNLFLTADLKILLS